MDLRMPNIDGLEATRRLRQAPRAHDMIVIGISASASQELEQQFLDAGGNGFLRKPIQLDPLLEKIKQHLGLEWMYAPVHQPSESQNPPAVMRQNLLPADTLKPDLVFPSEAELQELLKLATMHSITGLQEYASKLKEKDPRYLPFMTQIEKLTERFQFKKIADYITAYLYKEEERNDNES